MPEAGEVLAVLQAHYPLGIREVSFFRDGGSLSFVVEAEKQKFFLRIIRPAFLDTARQSIGIHLHLLKNGVPVPAIILTKDGAASVTVSGPQGESLYILYEYLQDVKMDAAAEAAELGRLAGRLHSTMKGCSGELVQRDRYFFIDRYIDLLRKKQYPKAEAFLAYGLAVWEKVKDLPRGYCHGDFHAGNILKTPAGQMYMIDFDTSCQAFPMYDVMMMCNRTHYFRFYKKGYAASKAMLRQFLTGYRHYAALSDAEIESFFDLIAVYHFQLQATIIEIYGLDCVNEEFLDSQLDWLYKWREQCAAHQKF
jgi:Ser/Thr protein kinase RdoA (MazF antagonist)